MDVLVADRALRPSSLVVEVGDPRALTRAERSALVERCARGNMALYASAVPAGDPSIPLRLGAQLGLGSAIATVPCEPDGAAWIPWHTEGYANPRSLAVGSWIMHCAHPRAGVEYAMLDPKHAWRLLREEGAAFVDALMQADAFAVGASRHAVFEVDARGGLRMRFTARRHALRWKCDPVVSEAAARLRRLLDSDAPCIVRTRLEAGMGIVANNVLLSRSMAGEAKQAPVLRACFHEPVAPPRGA